MVINFPGSGRSGGAIGAEDVSGHPLRHAMVHQVRAYWEGLRRGPVLPRRADIDPRGIEGALEGAFILDRIAPGMARFRLAGMGLVELMGMEVRGMPLSAMFDPMGRSRLAEGLEQVFTTPAILDLHLEAERGIGRPALSGRMIILPLQDDDGQSHQAFGCLATEGDIGRRPRRFFVTGTRVDPLTAIKTGSLNAATIAAPMHAAGMADPARGFALEDMPAGKPYLRLITTNS